ncbi:MAG TPA: hypothetical protein VJ945_06225 [Flavobacteriaceae bacterium]|nr:hypothetical protein [Flavobacteriaceae bacterium]
MERTIITIGLVIWFVTLLLVFNEITGIAHSGMGKGMFWFRIFGYGVSGKKVSNGLSFSERMGYTKRLQIFGWSFRFLKNGKP